jgi:hypothetical protein
MGFNEYACSLISHLQEFTRMTMVFKNIVPHTRLCLRGKYVEWRKVTVIPIPGETFICMEGPRDEDRKEIYVQDQNKEGDLWKFRN